MKKILIVLTIAISCLGINKVSADSFDLIHKDTVEYSCNFYYTDYNYLKELGFDDEIQEIYRMLIDEYNKNYSVNYPFYYIELVVRDDENCNYINEANGVSFITGFLNLFTEIPTSLVNGDVILSSRYAVSNTTFVTPAISNGYSYLPLFVGNENIYNPLKYFVSNFDYVHSGQSYNITGNTVMTINDGDIINPIYSSENAFQDFYEEINLNDYAYVALSLKDYNQNSFSTSVYVKGNYCLTPVYNYGMTERKDIISGTQVDRCSPYYENYTPVRTYITDSDLKNNSIYYLKSYDTSKDNFIKVDTSIFNITYITEENKNNPYVTIGGKTYPTIPYSELTDTAIKSEDEGYVSGAVEEFSFSDIFTAPLDFLKDVWNSISLVFSLITELLSLLPPVMQNFLYASFMLAIVLGLIKIIL